MDRVTRGDDTTSFEGLGQERSVSGDEHGRGVGRENRPQMRVGRVWSRDIGGSWIQELGEALEAGDRELDTRLVQPQVSTNARALRDLTPLGDERSGGHRLEIPAGNSIEEQARWRTHHSGDQAAHDHVGVENEPQRDRRAARCSSKAISIASSASRSLPVRFSTSRS